MRARWHQGLLVGTCQAEFHLVGPAVAFRIKNQNKSSALLKIPGNSISFCSPLLFHLGILINFSCGSLTALLAKENFLPKY